MNTTDIISCSSYNLVSYITSVGYVTGSASEFKILVYGIVAEVNSTHIFKSVIIQILKYFVLFSNSLSILHDVSYKFGVTYV